jgi:hypothetical protein
MPDPLKSAEQNMQQAAAKPCFGESLFLRKLLWASLPNKRQKLRDR